MPTNRTIQDIVKFVKGSSSHWINQNNIIKEKFSWAKGYSAFSVSKSGVYRVRKYIKNQEEHHRKKSFAEEYSKFLQVHGFNFDE